MSDTETMIGIGEDYPDIRDAVRKMCADFPGEYWRNLEDQTVEGSYPTEFVKALTDWKEVVRVKIEEAIRHSPPAAIVGADSLAEHALSIFEGGLILSRTCQDNQAMVRELKHYVTYLELLFGRVQS